MPVKVAEKAEASEEMISPWTLATEMIEARTEFTDWTTVAWVGREPMSAFARVAIRPAAMRALNCMFADFWFLDCGG